jgi:hypothetical protein
VSQQGANGSPKGASWSQKGAKSEPKGDQNASTNRSSEKVEKRKPKLCAPDVFWIRFGAIFHQQSINKNNVKLDAKET